MEKLGINLLNPNPQFWKERSVFLTGHTGFKGGWLTLWLSSMGAKVHGYALAPPTEPSFFEANRLQERLFKSTMGDIRDINKLTEAIREARPSVVIHMAAQPLVRESYERAVETFSINLMGTVHLLEAIRTTATVQAVVNITTDKCYENRDWIWPYRESDQLGGYDPYSSSKACSELATIAYRSSFLSIANLHVATARAGNVIGGGDWARDRIIPDFFKAVGSNEVMNVRSPGAVRPWQHVLEPLCGYLLLAERLVTDGERYAQAWNFGPGENDVKPVSWIIEHLCLRFPHARWKSDTKLQPHEADRIALDSAKAREKLKWRSRWALEIALDHTADWYQAWQSNKSMDEFSVRQIKAYEMT